MSRRLFTVLAIAMIATGALAPVPGTAATAPCTLETFAALNLPETTITLVESLPAGTNSAPVGNIALPICRVRGVIAPVEPVRGLDADGRLEREIPGGRATAALPGRSASGTCGPQSVATTPRLRRTQGIAPTPLAIPGGPMRSRSRTTAIGPSTSSR